MVNVTHKPFMLSVIMLSVIMLSVIMLSVVAPSIVLDFNIKHGHTFVYKVEPKTSCQL